MRTCWFLLLLSAICGETLLGAPRNRLALQGFDPVRLLEGTKVKGRADLEVEHGPYAYAFVDSDSRAAFLEDPERYRIQNGAACAIDLEGRMKAAPDVFVVHDGRIYTFACRRCVDRFEQDPTRYVKKAN